ncbi:hypothetical protein CRG98_044278 [Punica granatum]|uniref:Uncharacterized protein n=1 Tax=Punica granatum TaxID=22663 RepID=A0A2I0HUF1_PUNGR|nr:hypothetical protein CRG98_044278 [Punica granatum]
MKEHAHRYAQIEEPKTLADINRRIYTGLDPDWEPIVLAQSERMLTLTTEELQSLLVGHEERRLYAQGTQMNTSSTRAPLSGLLGARPTEVLYTDERKGGNGGKKNSEKSYGGKKHPDGKGGSGDFVDRSYGGNPNFQYGGEGLGHRRYGQVGQQNLSQNNSGQYNSGSIRDPQLSPGSFGPGGNFGPFVSGRPNPAHHIARGPAPLGNSAFWPNSMIICQICDRPGHTAPFCQYSGAQAHLAHGASPGIHDSDWYMDSRATHHVTNLNFHDDTSHLDHIFVGDGGPISVDASRFSYGPAFATGTSIPSSSSNTSTYILIPLSISIPLHEPSGPATLSLELYVPAPEIHDQSTKSGVLVEDAVGNDVVLGT